MDVLTSQLRKHQHCEVACYEGLERTEFSKLVEALDNPRRGKRKLIAAALRQVLDEQIVLHLLR